MKPKYTDEYRYPHGYTMPLDTDISKTWQRAREQLEKDRKEREEKVRDIKKIGFAK